MCGFDLETISMMRAPFFPLSSVKKADWEYSPGLRLDFLNWSVVDCETVPSTPYWETASRKLIVPAFSSWRTESRRAVVLAIVYFLAVVSDHILGGNVKFRFQDDLITYYADDLFDYHFLLGGTYGCKSQRHPGKEEG